MKALDRMLQRWRVMKAESFLRPGMRVLDVGCADGILRERVPELAGYVGIDPEANGEGLIQGSFPRDLPPHSVFDAAVLLAVLEHVPEDELAEFIAAIRACLAPRGLVVITVPSLAVDRIVAVLKMLRLLDGMSFDQHHGFEKARIPELFAPPDYELVARQRFQLGLNNLFVFRVSNAP